MENDYSDFIIADNTEEVAIPQTEEVETITEVTAEPTENVETTKEPTETQRVSQRINEVKQQAKDELVAEMGYVWNGKPITTEKQYKEALAEQKEQERRAELESKGIDPKMVDDAIENNPTVRQAKELIGKQAQEAAIQKNYADFLAEYPTIKPEQISKETWVLVNQGKSLVDAYAKQELKEMKEKLKVYEQNEKTSKKAPLGSITAHGNEEVIEEDDFTKGFNSIK